MSLSERVFHAIPFFHYDVAYLRTRTEHLELSFDLLDRAVAVLEDDSLATHMVEQVYLLQQYLQRRPEAWAKMRRFAAEGRLDVSPGMFVMPDMAMPSGEWLYLQAETGIRWCREALGLRPSVCWMADPWNHPATLPKVMRRCGYDAYVFARGADITHPNHFRWRGLDGTEMLAVRMPLHYDVFPPHLAETPDAPARLMAVLDRLDALHPPGQPVLVPIGGDFAAPAPDLGCLFSDMRKRKVRIAYSTLPRFIADLRRHWAALPILPADFSPTFQGTFSSRIGLKQANRRVESTVDRLWRYEAAGGKTEGPWREALPVALRLQFHDTLCGTMTDGPTEEALTEYEDVQRTLRTAFGRRPTSGERHIFNPSLEERTECVFLPGWSEAGARDRSGTPLPVQPVDGGAVVLASVPPLSTLEVRPGAEAATPEGAVSASESRLENDRIRVDLDDAGNVRQVALLGRNGRLDFLSGSRRIFNVLTLEHDYGDFWVMYHQPLDGHYVGRTPYADPLAFQNDPRRPWVASAGAFSDETAKGVTVVESGPLRARVRIEGELRLQRWRVPFVQTITLCAGSPRIEFRTTLRPDAKYVRVRAAFRPSLGQTEARYQVPFGVVARGVSEHAAHNGVALHGSNAGLMLLNRGLPGNGWDGEALTLSLLRCVAMEYKGASAGGYESGAEHVLDYAVIPFRETQAPDLCREGDLYNLPLAESADAVTGPPFTWEASPDVQVTRVERTGAGWRIHGHESRGRHARASLGLPGGWIVPVDILGEPAGEPVKESLEFHLGPWQTFMYGLETDRRRPA